jgi:flagellar basal-body rod protein FlgG
MIKGLYTSASGMVPRVRKQELIAHNISNAKTTGYKKDTMFTRELNKAERKTAVRKSDWQTPLVNEPYVDFSHGSFDRTGNPLDLAIDGDGFFTLQAEDGRTFLTRAGTFEVDEEGRMVFPGGLRLTSEGGTIEIGNGRVTIAQTGDVEVNGLSAGRVVPVTVANMDDLIKVGGSLFQVPEGVELTPVAQPTIRQGYLEAANIDIVREMVEMIISYRTYEANSRALHSQDESLGHLLNRVGGNR